MFRVLGEHIYIYLGTLHLKHAQCSATTCEHTFKYINIYRHHLHAGADIVSAVKLMW